MEDLRYWIHQRELEISDDQLAQIEIYCRELWRLNEQLNLTRHTTPKLFVDRDLVDAYQLARLLRDKERVLDIGSGGGTPGALVAILRPDLSVTLSESIGKKARALTEIIASLDASIEIYAGRAEELLSEDEFDVCTARAVGTMSKLLSLLSPHWKWFSRLLAIKGPAWPNEIEEARLSQRLRGLVYRVATRYTINDPQDATPWESVILEVYRR